MSELTRSQIVLAAAMCELFANLGDLDKAREYSEQAFAAAGVRA